MGRECIDYEERGAARELAGPLSLGISLLLAAIVVGVILFTDERAASAAVQRAAPLGLVARQHSPLHGLRDHFSTRRLRPDAAQLGIASYLRAHGFDPTLTKRDLPWDPLVWATFDFLRRFGW